MRNEDRIILREDLEEAGLYVLSTHGILQAPTVRLEATPGPDAAGPDELAAFIGFGGDTLRGTVTLVAHLSVVRAAYPLPQEGEIALADVLDWSGEIVNLLMGRLKNKLFRRGVSLSASTPKTVRALSLAIAPSSRMRVCSLLFSSGGRDVRVHFDALAAPGRPLFTAPLQPDTECITEGEVQLF